MLNYLIACGGSAASSAAATGNGCYDWPVIKQIIWLFSKALGYLYEGLDVIHIANIGLVIIIFTIIVKFILLPLTIQQQKFTKITNVMQPELRKVQEKYQGQRDQYSVQAMQAETKAIYNKYGVSQTGGCIQSFITFPVLIALYGALRNIPTAIASIGETLNPVVNAIAGADAGIKEQVSAIASPLVSADTNTVLTTLYSLPTKSWEALIALFGDKAGELTQAHNSFVSMNSFLGWDISQSPWNLIKGGGIGIIAIIIPLLAGFSQWLSVKLTQAKGAAQQSATAAASDPMASSTRMMTYTMPLMSVFFCFSLNTGLGIYWCMSAFFQCVLQILINRHYRKIDMEEFIKKNMEKAAAKNKKKGKKDDTPSTSIAQAASLKTKNIDNRPRTIKEIANMNVGDIQTPAKPAANSLAAKAASVQEYNEAHAEEEENGRKKYKK